MKGCAESSRARIARGAGIDPGAGEHGSPRQAESLPYKVRDSTLEFMSRTLKFVAGAIGALLLAIVALPFLIDANRFRPELESRLTQSLGRAVKVGDLKLSLLSGGVAADDLSIADDPAFSPAPFLQARSLHVRVDLTALIFSRKLAVRGLIIHQPRISLLQSPAGDWNFSTLGTKKAAAAPSGGSQLDLSVKLVKISGGTLTLGRVGGHLKPLVLLSSTSPSRISRLIAHFHSQPPSMWREAAASSSMARPVRSTKATSL